MMRLLRNLFAFVAGLATGRRTPTPRGGGALKPKRPDIPFWVYGWKGFFKRLLFVLPVLLIGGFLLAASGIISLRASSGHFPMTRWFLDFSKERSVSTYSMGISVPPLDHPALVLKGAGHFESGCRPCHGAVSGIPAVPRAMTPHPPNLPAAVGRWSAAELFYIVKHGIKFTGMPAFPSLEREDEVWAVVAFLLEMPDMSASEYARMVYGDAEAFPVDTSLTRFAESVSGQADTLAAAADTSAKGLTQEQPPIPTKAQPPVPTEAQPPLPTIEGLSHDVQSVIGTCRRCHGEGGRGRELSAFPRLAGQKPDYLVAAMQAYASGERHSGIMQPIAAPLSEDVMRAIAEYFSRSAASPRLGVVAVNSAPSQPDLDAAIARGRDIALHGVPSDKIPSCRDCHGPKPTRTNPFYPVIAGQWSEYLRLQLELFNSGRRGGSAYAHIMEKIAARLSDEQMRDVALYYESLGGGPVTSIDSYMDSLVKMKH